MLRTRNAIALLAVLAAVLVATMPGFSSASFSSRSTATSGSVSAAADWTPPTVSLASPGSPVKDTVTLTATAADGESGIASVQLQYLAPNGNAWVTICTATSAPYTCAWNTKLGADGAHDLRAVATDGAGYSTTSSLVSTTVANNLLVVLGDPGDVVRGTVTLPTTLYNSGSVTYTVRVEYSPAGTNSWRNVCTNLSSPYSCSWNTATYANDYVDLRAVAVAGGTTYTSALVTDVLVDNLAPVLSMTDPGTPLSGTRTFAATATDAHSGIAQVVLQYAATGTTTWKNLCTLTAEPYSCRYDTTTIPDGSYGFRAVATDVAGNTTTSATVANRVVDNTVSSVAVEDPGAFLSGTVTLNATASSTAGIASVRIQRAPNGTTTWTDVCTDTTAPYACAWDTATVADGLYDLRAVLVDGQARTTTSASITARRVDNSVLKALDVQSANGGATASKVETGDSITFTYSSQVNPATVTSGWTGSPLAVSVRLRDGNLLGLGNKGDTLDVLRTGGTVNLGSVNLKEDYVRSSKSATFNATMVLGSRVVGGVTQSTVTLTLGTLSAGSGLKASTLTAAMVWTPSTVVTDLAAKPCSAVPVTETGALDRDF